MRDDDGRELADGEIGRLWVRGGARAWGYLRELEKTQATFRGEWVVPGDLVSRDADGFFTYQGRGDDVFKVAGSWFSPAEVEGTPAAPPAGRRVRRGRDRRRERPAQAARLGDPEAATPDLGAELADFVAKELLPFKAPRVVHLVDELPRTHLGQDRSRRPQAPAVRCRDESMTAERKRRTEVRGLMPRRAPPDPRRVRTRLAGAQARPAFPARARPARVGRAVGQLHDLAALPARLSRRCGAPRPGRAHARRLRPALRPPGLPRRARRQRHRRHDDPLPVLRRNRLATRRALSRQPRARLGFDRRTGKTRALAAVRRTPGRGARPRRDRLVPERVARPDAGQGKRKDRAVAGAKRRGVLPSSTADSDPRPAALRARRR